MDNRGLHIRFRAIFYLTRNYGGDDGRDFTENGEIRDRQRRADCRRVLIRRIRPCRCGEYFNQEFLGEYEHFFNGLGIIRADCLACCRQFVITVNFGDNATVWR